MNRQEAFTLYAAVAETVHKAGQIPSGHVYAALLDRITYADYTTMIASLVHSGLIAQDPSHLLRWVGPLLPGEC